MKFALMPVVVLLMAMIPMTSQALTAPPRYSGPSKPTKPLSPEEKADRERWLEELRQERREERERLRGDRIRCEELGAMGAECRD